MAAKNLLYLPVTQTTNSTNLKLKQSTITEYFQLIIFHEYEKTLSVGNCCIQTNTVPQK